MTASSPRTRRCSSSTRMSEAVSNQPQTPRNQQNPEIYDTQRFYEGLVQHGLIVPVAVQGAFGRGAVFEDVLERFNGLITQISKDDGAELYTFPPVIDRTIIEKTDYLDSFPHLAGTVFSFFGKERQAKELSERVHG